MDKSILLTTLVLSIVGIIVMNIKAIFSSIYDHITNFLVFTTKIDEASEFFYCIQKYVFSEKQNRVRNYYYRNIYDDFIAGEDRNLRLLYNYGFIIMKFHGTYILLNKVNQTMPNSITPYKNEKQQIFIYSFSRKKMLAFIEYIREKYGNDKLKYYFNNDGEVKVLSYVPNKTFDNIFLNDGMSDVIKSDLNTFSTSKHVYESMGLKYKRTYFFHGPAGTGKSSLIVAIANHLKRDVLSINWSKEMTDATLIRLVASRPHNSIIAFEDIDCLFDNLKRTEVVTDDKEKKNEPKITLSCILNILDGSYTPNDVVFVLTTNYIEKIDEAILRDGRTDFLLNVDKPNKETKRRYLMYLKKLNPSVDVDRYLEEDITLSTLQKAVFQN